MSSSTPIRGARVAGLSILLLVLLAIHCVAAQTSPEPVKLVVIVSVDGLSWPRLSGYQAWYEAGFKRLLEESQVETACNYTHLNTETGPGHASLGTGATPSVHGIVANNFFVAKADGSGLQRVYCVEQSSPSGKIMGPANLRVHTFADQLVNANPGSQVVSLSGKDRAAILLAGKDPRHIVYWYDRKTGTYISSAAYDQTSTAGTAASDLIKQFNKTQAGAELKNRFHTLWQPLPEPSGAAGYPHPEPNLRRFQMIDLGLGFDHDLTLDLRGYYNAIYGTPFQDQLLTDLALTFLADPSLKLGRRGVPDLLALSFSANDTVSHSFGSESEEALDTLRRLDRELGRLLKVLDDLAAATPKGKVLLALSADHGFTPLPEVMRSSTGQRLGGRLISETDAGYPTIQERLNRALTEDLRLKPGSKPIFGIDGWSVAFDPTLFPAENAWNPDGPKITLSDLNRAFPTVVKRLYEDEIEDILLISERASWPKNAPGGSFAENDLDAERSGNAFLVPRKYVLMHFDASRGSGHGSHHEYDTHVPLLFWGGPFKAEERNETCAPYDLAPTLADVLGVSLPDKTGKSLLPQQ